MQNPEPLPEVSPIHDNIKENTIVVPSGIHGTPPQPLPQTSEPQVHYGMQSHLKKKGGWPKGRKRKRGPRDANAPRQPLNGYVRFLNEKRERVRKENPSASFAEITKILAGEWSKLPTSEKQRNIGAQVNYPNKAQRFGFREAELRQLRKSNTEYEEQNAILSKHIDKMKAAIEKLEVETVQQRNNNLALQQHLDNLRATLTASFAAIPLPVTNEVPSLETVDSYMGKLHTLILDNPQENEALIHAVREIVSRLDYQG
ncbi:high mobility group protein 20A-like [Limulus polyphemus]|uniref:High mobility group protein 20A-like n=1 Tax=Limulus polyphemus TaxID=6850 RepID=A0ABM1SCV5_LIMPO|nr:high mobility group protein 20A-like [Limulus polyphemus]